MILSTLLAGLLTTNLIAQAVPSQSPTIVFVCEHGAVKSVIATAYFNKLAADRHLPFRVTFRGVNPQEALSGPHTRGSAIR
jgi:protein-tyrosine-phosphatase